MKNGQPIAASGITIGYGYDLGQQTANQINIDLNGIFSSSEITRFANVAGLKSSQATAALPNVSNINVSKKQAYDLSIVMKKRYAQQVVDIYPQAIKLHPHCQGVLLSLVVNRGNGLEKKDETVDITIEQNKTKDRRREMRQIQDDLRNKTLENIPGRLRSMKRLWEDEDDGLVNRRKGEAVLFEKGMDCKCFE
jgi:GH24 family phage-related lysozyme (muramidase)